MSTSKWIGLSGGKLLVLVLIALFPASGQGMQNVIHSRSRLFPAIGPGVSSLKRDATGRYYILAEPASTILIFDSAGRGIGQIPNANSRGAAIHYAISIDIDSHGLVYVADRGDNAIKIFAPNGALIASVPVTAPTSVVALSDNQFAVTKLQSKRLVQIMDESGATIRTFGDPADEPGSGSVAAQPLPNTGSPSALPVMDRGRITGDSSGNIYFAFTTLADPVIQRFDRYGYSAYDSVMPANEFGALAGRTGRDIEIGYTMSGLTGPATVTAWTDLHSVETSASTGNRRGARATGGSPATGLGGGGTAGSSAADSSTPAIAGDSSDFDGQTLSYDAQNTAASADALFAMPGLGTPGLWMPGMMGMGLGDPFRFGGMHGGGGFGGLGGEGLRSGFFGGRPFDGAEGFGHFHPGGVGTYRATGMLRVGLDDPSKHKLEKPVITAVGVDPQTEEAWAAIGDMLAHLDRNGSLLDTYYVTITGDISIKPTAILVEPDRILIASDPWGIYEFPRPDKPSSVPLKAPQGSLVPQQAPAARQP